MLLSCQSMSRAPDVRSLPGTVVADSERLEQDDENACEILMVASLLLAASPAYRARARVLSRFGWSRSQRPCTAIARELGEKPSIESIERKTSSGQFVYEVEAEKRAASTSISRIAEDGTLLEKRANPTECQQQASRLVCDHWMTAGPPILLQERWLFPCSINARFSV